MRCLPIFVMVFALLLSRSALSHEIGSFSVAPLGMVRVYRTVEHPSRVLILVSGEKGWDEEAGRLAEKLASLDGLVIGVDTREYLGGFLTKSNCTYPASDMENLSRFVQQKLHLSSYTRPILAGYAAGAALVYATVAQAPSNVLAGGVSIGFCPDAPLLRAVCPGLGVEWSKDRRQLLPAAGLHTPWIVLPSPGKADCSQSTDAFLKLASGEMVSPPETKGGAGPDVEDALLSQAVHALSVKEERAESAQSADIKDLPLVEVPAKGKSAPSGEDLMAVMISGDGGWAGLDREVGDAIAGSGVPMLGFNSLKYFWTPRTPDTTAHDIGEAITHYLNAWNKERLILIGYSFGADILPFVVNRLPETLKDRISLVVLMGASTSAQFEFHLSNWFEGATVDALPTLPEARKMKAGRTVCMFGEDEADSLCPSLDASVAQIIKLPGGHHFDGDYPALARRILSLAGLEETAP